MYQNLYDKAKKIIKKYASKEAYDVSGPLYLETYASGVGLGGRLLQVREGMDFGYDDIPDNAALCPTDFIREAY